MKRNSTTKLSVSSAVPTGQKSKTVNVTVSNTNPKPKKGRNRKRKNRARQPDLRLASKFLYAASLHDPWGVAGARIPDERVLPTAVCRSVFRTTITAFAYDTDNPAKLGCGFAVNLGNVYPFNVAPFKIPTVANASAGGLTWPAGNAAWPNESALLSAANTGIRLVSAGLAIVPTMSSQKNSGRISMVQWPNYAQRPSGLVADNVWDQAYPFQTVCGVNLANVCCIAYRPKNHSNFEFYEAGGQVGPETANGSNSVGGLGCWIRGLDAGATFEVVAVANWEIIPTAAFSGILPTEFSRYDVKALEFAFNSTQGSDMFTSYPKDVYNATVANFSEGSSAILSSLGGALSSGESFIERLHSTAGKVLDLTMLGFNLASYLGGVRPALGNPQVPQIAYTRPT